MYLYWDPTYILVIIGAFICLMASLNVKATFSKYSRVYNSRGMTAQDAAQAILAGAGIYDVRIEYVSGSLTDHYSPQEKVLRLSDSTYNQTSVAAIGVAAHECGHAIQDYEGYAPLKLRSAAVPIANIGSSLSWPLIIIGIIFGIGGLARAGVFLFTFVVVFQLITLPVEFNASHRAMRILGDNALLTDSEQNCARSVLTAAALTYVASLLSSILQLFRLIVLTQGNNRRRR